MPQRTDNDVVTDVSPEGVDLTLIRAFLALTPAQRLEFIDDRLADLETIREANERR